MSKTNKLPGSLHSKVRIIFDELSNFDVAELADLETIAEWPQSVRQLLLTSVILLVVTTGYVSFLSAVRIELESGQVREAQLRAEFSLKAMEASQLGAMQAQTEALGLAFKGLLRQLPSSAEVPSLVDNIAATGLGSGLEFSRIQLQGDTKREFFYELPIEIELVGNYHDFGMFVSGVASLGRIVTLHDFKIDSGVGKLLEMRLIARTYRYDKNIAFAPIAERESADGAL